jgi:hypothetical protein
VVTITPGDATAAAGLRKPEIVHTQGRAELDTVAPLLPGKFTINSPSNAKYLTIGAPAYIKLLHDMPSWRSRRPTDDPASATKPSPDNLIMEILGTETYTVTFTATSGAFATEDEMLTDEPDIGILKMAG